VKKLHNYTPVWLRDHQGGRAKTSTTIARQAPYLLSLIDSRLSSG